MIKEEYVSFEVAKLLKEKGFNEPTIMIYNDRGVIDNVGSIYYYNSEPTFRSSGCISAPTQQMAMRWLREKHKLFIQICIIPHTTITIEQKYYLFTIHKDRRTLAFRKDFPSEYYFTYEEACEAAIKYSLENLILL